MHLDFLRTVFAEAGSSEALIWRDRGYGYDWLSEHMALAAEEVAAAGISTSSVVSLEADFSPKAIATLLALLDRSCILVPLSSTVADRAADFRATAEVEFIVTVGNDDAIDVRSTGVQAQHDLFRELKSRGHPGLVLFSSGSTGESKAAVHDVLPMLDKFRVRRRAYRAITFLLFDHIGGFNTLLYSLSNGGCIVTVQDRAPETVCRAIERHRVQLLPTSPTFLNLLLVTQAFQGKDLRSLELVTYGTEPMPESTLRRLHEALPEVRLQQTYGLSELGILRSKSEASDSLWVRIGGEGFETRVVDGLLEIRARSAMLGYLNAPSPFTDDGWFRTGDRVEQKGDFFRILGRDSEIINVGGEKVYPAEVEGVLEEMEGVDEAVVAGEAHPLTGQIVVARVKLSTDEELSAFRKRMRIFLGERLTRFKVPPEGGHRGRFHDRCPLQEASTAAGERGRARGVGGQSG